MVTVKLLGGIGNQMFQYAAAKSLAVKLSCPLLLDTCEFEGYDDRQFDLHVFPNISEPFVSEAQHRRVHSKSLAAKIKRRLAGVRVYKEPHYHVDADFFDLTAPIHLTGYFQSEKYFSDHESLIRKVFEWDVRKLSQTTLSYMEDLSKCTATGVHFRRGDYVSNHKASDHHGTCDLRYYRTAISLMRESFPDSHFFVFSDDIPWVKSEGVLDGTAHTYIEKTGGMHDSEEMFLLSQCKNNIIANSSFSWWGAWLNGAADKLVVAPQKWFRAPELDTRDLLPESWLKV